VPLRQCRAMASRPVPSRRTRAVLQPNRLLLVNAWVEACRPVGARPGGGVEPHSSLHDTLIREVQKRKQG